LPKLLLVANTDWYLYNFRLSLGKYLRDQGFEVVMVSPPGRFVAGIEKAGFRWINWSVGRRTVNPLKELKALFSLKHIYRQEKPDLVHHFTIKPVLYGTFAGIGLPAAIANSITGLGYLFLQTGLKARILRVVAMILYRIVFQRSGLTVIFENTQDREFFLKHHLIKTEYTRIIEGAGVDEEWFSPSAEEEGKPLVVLPGRMLWDKGVGLLVEAARILHQRCDVRVALVGNTDPGNPANIQEEMIEQWVKEGVVEWWGFKEDMRPVYAQAHVIVLPSSGEGLPTALIEAAACARPVVTTDVPGCREVVEDGQTGFLVPPGNPAALANVLEKLILDPGLRIRMGSAGRQRVLNRFTNHKINSAILNTYHQLLVEK
jgi:glycosyltransferase involved in cell wall biosynthesis